MASVTILPGAVERLARDMAFKWHAERAPTMTRLFAAEAPIDTGELRASHRLDPSPIRVGRDWVIRWRATAGHAIIIYSGRGEVRPRNASVLRWVTKTGQVVYAMRSGPVPPNRWFNRVFIRVGFRDVRTARR